MDVLLELREELYYSLLNGEEYLKVSSKLKGLIIKILEIEKKNNVLDILKGKINILKEKMDMASALEVYCFISHMILLLQKEEKIEGAIKVEPNNMKYEVLSLQDFLENRENKDIRSVERLLKNLEGATDGRLSSVYYAMKEQKLEEVIKQYVKALNLREGKIKNINSFFKHFCSFNTEEFRDILIEVFNNGSIEYKKAALVALSKMELGKEFVLSHLNEKEFKSIKLQCEVLIDDEDIAKDAFKMLEKEEFKSLFNDKFDILSKELSKIMWDNVENEALISGFLNSRPYLKRGSYDIKRLLKDVLKNWQEDSIWLV